MWYPLRSASLVGCALGVAWTVLVPAIGQSQAPAVDVRRAQATRPELEAALKEFEEVIASPGYSKSYRKGREAEIELVRARLADGDFQVGDEVDIVVVNEAALTAKFKVLPGRVLNLPLLTPISVAGVLRSEIRDHLTTEIGKYVKNPQVTIQGSFIRLAIFGAVGSPGYYTVAADALVSETIMLAGGPQASVKMEKSVVRRQGNEVIAGTEIQRAIEGGQSLDQLNLHGGDELLIGGASRGLGTGIRGGGGGGLRTWLWPVQTVISLTYLLTRLKIF